MIYLKRFNEDHNFTSVSTQDLEDDDVTISPSKQDLISDQEDDLSSEQNALI